MRTKLDAGAKTVHHGSLIQACCVEETWGCTYWLAVLPDPPCSLARKQGRCPRVQFLLGYSITFYVFLESTHQSAIWGWGTTIFPSWCCNSRGQMLPSGHCGVICSVPSSLQCKRKGRKCPPFLWLGFEFRAGCRLYCSEVFQRGSGTQPGRTGTQASFCSAEGDRVLEIWTQLFFDSGVFWSWEQW